MTFHEACAAICRNRESPALTLAVNYARAGLTMTDPEEVRVQALYIVTNMTHWCGDEARVVRAALKRIGGLT